LDGYIYNIQELLDAFRSVSSYILENKIKICFFIDGLDECEGDPNDIIKRIIWLNSLPNIKTCVSSRPRNEFNGAFGQTSLRKLLIENFNRPDIEQYVRDTLEEHVDYQELQRRDNSDLDLVKDVVDAANGVFLWVYLVVQSLVDGLTNGDRIIYLQRSLHLLPMAMKDLFESMFNNIDKYYQDEAAHMLLVALAARNPLPLSTYYFIEHYDRAWALRLDRLR
jgi:hypothetical protein